MPNPEHLAILQQGVKVWNDWREKNPSIRPDFSNANFNGWNLAGANLSLSNLTLTDFCGANLTNADLRNVNMTSSQLRGADFTWANLAEANLSRANLTGAIFKGTVLTNVDFAHAIFWLTELYGVDLSTAKGLETVDQMMSCHVDIATIYASKGLIPESFLRAAHIPETMIAFARFLFGRPTEFFSCFISHSAKDKRFCERLYADLQANNVAVWYFPEDAKWGESVWGEIDRSIKIYDKLIVVCSENSLQSGPVNREIERALNREDKESKNILFPITLDDYVFADWEHPRKTDVLSKVIGDFRGWNRNEAEYDAAFGRLLKALKAND